MTRYRMTRAWLPILCASGAWAIARTATSQTAAPVSPAEGYTVHVTAPHVVAGVTMGPYHHYCKVRRRSP